MLQKNRRFSSVTIFSIFFYLVVSVFGLGVPLAINATGGSQSEIYLHGPVTSKYLSQGRHSSTHVTIDEQTQHRPFTFEISASDYNGIFIGQDFGETMRKGRLGVFYRWRF